MCYRNEINNLSKNNKKFLLKNIKTIITNFYNYECLNIHNYNFLYSFFKKNKMNNNLELLKEIHNKVFIKKYNHYETIGIYLENLQFVLINEIYN